MIRDKNHNWKPEAVDYSNEFINLIKPLFNKGLERGFTEEDIYFLMSTSVHELILDRALDMKSK